MNNEKCTGKKGKKQFVFLSSVDALQGYSYIFSNRFGEGV